MRVRTGLITFNGQFEGLGQTKRFGNLLVLINRPQETVYALQLLYVAFEQYFMTVAEYNRRSSTCFMPLATQPKPSPRCGHPVRFSRSIRCVRPSCLPWAKGRRQRPNECKWPFSLTEADDGITAWAANSALSDPYSKRLHAAIAFPTASGEVHHLPSSTNCPTRMTRRSTILTTC